MGTLTHSLLSKDIHLPLRAGNPADALEEILSGLRSDERVRDWETLRSSLVNGSPIDCGTPGNGMIVLHHRRTAAVTSMILAAGRFPAGIAAGECGDTLRMVFLAAVPESLDNEYLRIIGAVSRICGTPDAFGRLMAAPDASVFIRLLEEGCRQ